MTDDTARERTGWKAPQIIGLGMATLDVLARLTDLPTWEDGVRLDGLAIEGGGPVATALAAAARLGARASYLGTYGSDILGKIKQQTLLDYQVDLSHALQRPEPENAIVLVTVHSETGERIFSGTGGWLERNLLPAELDRDFITSAGFLHLDGFHPQAALAAARWMKAAGKTVMLDGSATRGPIPDRYRALIELADFLICGSGFVPSLTGCSDIWEAGEAALKLGPRVVVQTEGKDGSYTVTPGERFHTPAFDVDVIDTTGAGDVFHGAYMVGLLQGWDLRRIATFASAVAAIKCTRLGGRSGIPTFKEALRFIENHTQAAKLP